MFIIGLLILLYAPYSLCSGVFQLEIINYDHRFMNKNQEFVYKLCLKESNTFIYSYPCTYGNVTSQPSSSTPVNIKLPFTFRWMKSFTLIVSVLVPNGKFKEEIEFKEIEKQIHFDDNVLPTNRSNAIDSWLYKSFKTPHSQLNYRYRVYCSIYYHGDECSSFCRERDDIFGHYLCLPNGQKKCSNGWTGDNCDAPKCRAGCNQLHGYCSLPDECLCRPGYSGQLCNQCLIYPGCLHGYCLKPWQCICYRNWGGILCDQDLNYCGTHQPCLNGGICVNIAPNQYKCHCKTGYDGDNCQIVVNPCVTSPCLHGGTCNEFNNSSFFCTCQPGWTGNRCQININECLDNPCLNNGKCIDLINGFQCICSSGFTGETCQFDIDECNLEASSSPCISSTTEYCENTQGSFKCHCIKGFEGAHCEQNINDCQDSPCANQATCIDLINDYQCVCQKGFKGNHCQEIDENICAFSSNSYWEMVSKTESCPIKWCKCSQLKGPYCICIHDEITSSYEQSAQSNYSERNGISLNPSNSIVLVFEKSLTNSQIENICNALKAIFILYQDMKKVELSTTCHHKDYNSIIFYSSDNSANVLKVGDILLNTRTSFRIKEIIKNKQEENKQMQLLLSLSTTIIILIIISLISGIGFFIINKYVKKKKETVKNQRVNISRVQNNLRNNERPFSINVLSSSPYQFKSNDFKKLQDLYHFNSNSDSVIDAPIKSLNDNEKNYELEQKL